MTDIQKKIMKLVDEIDAICKEKNLFYALADQTAGCAMYSTKFTNGTYIFRIMMPLSDICVLQEYLESHPIENRLFESYEVNEKLEEFCFRYVDTRSLIIDGVNAFQYKYPGVAVTILPLRLTIPPKKVLGSERYLNNTNVSAIASLNKNVPSSWWHICICKTIVKLVGAKKAKKILRKKYCVTAHTAGIHLGALRCIFGSKAKLAQWVLEENVKLASLQSEDSEIENYWYMIPNSRIIHIPIEDIRNPEFVDFEKRTLPIVGNAQEYFRKLYGQSWEVRATKPLQTIWEIQIISDANLPFAEYLEFIEKKDGWSMEEVLEHRKAYNRWRIKEYQPAKRRVSHTFKRIRRSVDRIDVWYQYRDKREQLKELFEKQNFEQLEAQMQLYLEKTEEYVSRKISFYIDEELFTYAAAIWERQGREEYAGKVYNMVPDLYKNEDVETYLRKRGRI